MFFSSSPLSPSSQLSFFFVEYSWRERSHDEEFSFRRLAVGNLKIDFLTEPYSAFVESIIFLGCVSSPLEFSLCGFASLITFVLVCFRASDWNHASSFCCGILRIPSNFFELNLFCSFASSFWSIWWHPGTITKRRWTIDNIEKSLTFRRWH